MKNLKTLSTILTAREKLVIVMKYGIPNGKEMTLADIGRSMGLTRERVRQIEQGAIKKIKSHPATQFLRDYLG